MTASIDKLRTLAAQNASLSAQAQSSQQAIYDAAERECTRLNMLISSTKPADVILDDAKAQQYQSWVMQRAQLLELLAGKSA